ncbi:Uncharacterised protein [Mycobacteroides abscessus subsp. massiliense]|nr:Uncharacterised protein [Mycobacteroides abscessus subsp. massiliense]
MLRTAQRGLRHGMRLPALHIVTVGLPVPDGRAEAGRDVAVIAYRPHRQKRDLVVEVDKSLDDHAVVGDPAARHRVVPGLFDIGRSVELALPLAGAAHERLHHAGVADAPGLRVDRRLELIE